MITIDQYFGNKLQNPDATEDRLDAADVMLEKVNSLLVWAKVGGYKDDVDPDTGSQISGSRGGSGDGGFRLHNASTGKAMSKHKLARAVDVFDPDGVLDRMLDDEVLTKFGLYREHPDDTPGWCHLQDAPPGSGHRTFKP